MQPIFSSGRRGLSSRRYERLFELASGGMGTVYVGRRLAPGGFQRLVAIKAMHASFSEDPESMAAFRDEAHLASLVQHANVVAIHDVYEEGGEHLLVMDYVDGPSLATLLGALRGLGKRLTRRVGLRIVHDALRGLDAAHEVVGHDGRPLELVHRDATPHNILLGSDGIARLTDFGVARALARSARTEPGCAKGKFAYMAPEQAFADAIDRRVDVFAMGVVLWETLTGHRLFANRTRNEAARGAALGDIAAPSSLAPGTPVELDRIVLRALSPWREDRYPTARAFADAILAFAAGEGGLAPASAVGEVIDMACGDAIRTRRDRIRGALSIERVVLRATAAAASGHASDATLRESPREGSIGSPTSARLATPDATAVDVPVASPVAEPRAHAVALVVASFAALAMGIGVGAIASAGEGPSLARHLGVHVVRAMMTARLAIAADSHDASMRAR